MIRNIRIHKDEGFNEATKEVTQLELFKALGYLAQWGMEGEKQTVEIYMERDGCIDARYSHALHREANFVIHAQLNPAGSSSNNPLAHYTYHS